MTTLEELDDLLEQARGGDRFEKRSKLVYRRLRALLDPEAELRRESHRAEHPHRVFAKSDRRLADAANEARPEIGQAAREVEDGLVADVEIEGVDGEVAPCRVLFAASVDVVVEEHADRLGGPRLQARPECRDLEDLPAPRARARGEIAGR